MKPHNVSHIFFCKSLMLGRQKCRFVCCLTWLSSKLRVGVRYHRCWSIF